MDVASKIYFEENYCRNINHAAFPSGSSVRLRSVVDWVWFSVGLYLRL